MCSAFTKSRKMDRETWLNFSFFLLFPDKGLYHPDAVKILLDHIV